MLDYVTVGITIDVYVFNLFIYLHSTTCVQLILYILYSIALQCQYQVAVHHICVLSSAPRLPYLYFFVFIIYVHCMYIWMNDISSQ